MKWKKIVSKIIQKNEYIFLFKIYHRNVFSPSTPLSGTRVKAHSIVHNILSQGSFYKIL
jgi:hypothetical protein